MRAAAGAQERFAGHPPVGATGAIGRALAAVHAERNGRLLVLLLATLLALFASGARAMPAASCHIGAVCHVPETMCAAGVTVLPARLAVQPRTPPPPERPALAESQSLLHVEFRRVTLPDASPTARIYLLTARMRR